MQAHPISCRAALAVAALAASFATASHAADWSDTSIGWRTGSKFAEPFNPEDIKKNILNLTHVSGYKYGTNFFNVDYLLSDKKDPAFAGSNNGATEVYIVYRHTLDIEKVSGMSFKMGPMRSLGFTAGFDVNTKTDAGYNSKKRMLVLGPTVSLDVPGFLNVSLLQLWESNAPYSTLPPAGGVPRYQYKAHPMLTAAWGIPLGKTGLSFEGFMNYIAAKGADEFGNGTAPETNFDAQIMYDLGSLMGAGGKFKVGIEYQYWKNKFGNSHKGPAGNGAFAKTPMLRAEYHF
ncbi:Outer envelope protein [Rubrivivax sp. A210]|uniref:outer envelope protein n=1 Tax=Rubrivivax sp. A210 TaxID=2772301 RepID=UPI001917CB3A|nr:outer envelope protein [Rubrivivax sp. A210]CAD5372451.1 Outer envelope protein [Rubrivivax sp. A210]